MARKKSRFRLTWFDDRGVWMMQWRDPITNKVRSKTASDDRSESERMLADFEHQWEAGQTPKEMTWAEARKCYEEQHVARLSGGHKAKVTAALNRAERQVGCHKCSAIPMANWGQHVASMTELAPATVAGHVRILRHFFKWLYGNGWIERVPKVPAVPHANQARGRPLLKDELRAFRDALQATVPNHVEEWLWSFDALHWSGLRLSEALSLSWDARAVNRVEWIDGQARLKLHQQKNKRHDLAPTLPKFEALLRQTAVWDRKGYVFWPWLARNPHTKSHISRVFSRAGAIAQIEVSPNHTATAHDLRRTFAWEVVRDPDISVADATKLTRHCDASVLLRYYAMADSNDLSYRLRGKKLPKRRKI